MAKTKAYTKYIQPRGTEKGDNASEDNLINQSSPGWVLGFIRWNVRDTLRSNSSDKEQLLNVRKPLIVENDCIALSVSISKSVLTHSMSATLVETDVNYSTAIAPGDFVSVNMLDWPSDARRIADKIASGGQINRVKDGFKGMFKIQSVRETISVDETGSRRILVKITGYSFTEFNNSIYFNPYMRVDNQGSDKNNLLFPTNLATDYAQLINPDTNPSCELIITKLIQSFIGVGVSSGGETSSAGTIITPNTHFYIPQQVGSLLGQGSAKAAKDVYNYVFGLQKYSGSGNASLASGMNPSNLAGGSQNRFYSTNIRCLGNTLLRAEYWNQVKAWSIINQYTNAPINELFTTVRVDPEGNVMPTVVFRQIPFSSNYFGEAPFDLSAEVTPFLSLPRWKISPALVLSADLGRDEAARINFVQYYATPSSDIGKPDAYLSAQTQSGNFVFDSADVMRSGLRPMVVSTSFQDLTLLKDEYIGKRCAYILGDAVMGEHLKLNGSLECIGIVDPIAVGDNLEFDGTVFHIEEVNHVCNIGPTGGTTFRTVLRLSHGVSVNDSGVGTTYAEMTHTNAYRNRESNFNIGNQMVPGSSEEQDVRYRPNGPAPTEGEINKSDRPFAQPGKSSRGSDDE